MPPRKATSTKTTTPSTSRPILQWTIAGLGAAVTLAAVAIVIWEAVQPDMPPDLHAEVADVQRTAHGYIAKVKVINEGLETAAAVEIEGSIATEQASASIAYVPSQGHAVAFLRFATDPKEAVIQVKGWSEP